MNINIHLTILFIFLNSSETKNFEFCELEYDFCMSSADVKTHKQVATSAVSKKPLKTTELKILKEKITTFGDFKMTSKMAESTAMKKTITTVPITTTSSKTTIHTTIPESNPEITTTIPTTKSISSSTEVVSTTVSPVMQTCNLTWKHYDPFNDPQAPKVDGLLLGYYIDGSPIYVGRGSSIFFMKYTLPARVYINDTTSKSGIYVVSYPNEFCDTSGSAQYLATNADYDYKWIMSSQGQMESNAVGWVNSRYNFSVARINLTTNDGNQISQIGASVSSLGTIYYNPVQDTISTMGLKSYEALICVPKNEKYVHQFCAFEWKHYDPINNQNAPSVDGIIIGSYYDNTSVYVGRGNDICDAITPARVNIVNGTQSPGVYTSCDGVELQDTSISAEYLVKNPDYTYFWVNASSNDKILNAVKWNYLAETLAVSRIKIYNRKNKSHFTTIGKTFVGTGTWYYNPITNYTDSIGMQNVEFLLCSPNNSTIPIKAAAKGCVHNWKRFNYRSKNISYLTDGILAGYYYDGSPFYIGAGFQVNTSDIVPARVMDGNSSKPGVYVCANEYEYIDRKSSAQYLVYNDSQMYQWVRSKPKYYVQNQIEIDGLYATYTIARVNLTGANNNSFSQIGTNYVGAVTYYYNPVMKTVNNISQYSDYVEILTCVVKS